MEARGLDSEIYQKLKDFGVTRVILSFSGGSDEGYLDVTLTPESSFDSESQRNQRYALCQEVEKWAWSVYDYSGAGDGSDYGDDIVYDLENKKISTSEWFTQRAEGQSSHEDLFLCDPDKE